VSFVPPPPPAVPPPLPGRRTTSRRQSPPLPPLDFTLLADLPSLELRARYLVDGFLCGRHRSPQKGSSVEFAEYRAYQPGDDLRRVDWRLYGRTDRLHVKQYEDETQLHVYLVLDTSLSMHFRSRGKIATKLDHARLALAAIGLISQRQSDAFGLALVGEELRDYLRARSSLPHWRTFVGRLDGIEPEGQTNLAKALEDLAELLPPRALVVIASDFYEEDDRLDAALQRLRYDHHDLIGLHVLDPVEVDFDLESAGRFIDVESNAQVRLDPAAARAGYLERFSKFCSGLDETFHRAGGELLRLRTDTSPVAALTSYFAHRAHRL
jgi:uncharacterized protein (DUF58 family)